MRGPSSVAGRLRRRLAAALCALSAALSLAGCQDVPPSPGQPEGPTIAIGVPADEPGMGLWHNGGYSGFEVDVARYVAKRLGYAEKQIVFKRVRPSDRAALLDDGSVDMVVAGYGVSPAHGREALLSAPYLTADLSLLVRGSDRSVRRVADMAGKVACVVEDGDAGPALAAAVPDVTLSERDTYQQCVTALMVGSADAIAADDAILSGLSAYKGNGYLTRPKGTYGKVSYAVAVRSGDERLNDQIDAALDAMRRDGTWRRLVDDLHDSTGFRPAGRS